MSDELKPATEYETKLCEGIAVIMRREMKKVYDIIDTHFERMGAAHRFNAVKADLIPDATKDVGELLTLLRNTRTPDSMLATVVQILGAIIENDKTYYNHHDPRPDGKLPKEAGGTIWYTPKQLAKRALKALTQKGGV